MTGRARLGVDFGTANTAAVLALPGREPRPLLFDGSPLLPSAVCADPSGRLLVGRDAVHTAAAQPASFEPHPKRCIDDATVLLDSRELPVTDLIAAVLRRAAAEATRAAGRPPGEVVLTHPAAWGPGRRDTLRAAAADAGLTVRLVPEPVAAACHFAEADDALAAEGATALIYDFGAGTFDASLVRRTAGGFEILATQGLPDCGGLDVDAAVVAYLGAVLRDRDPAAWARLSAPSGTPERRASRHLWDNVRTAKEMLSRTTGTTVHVPLLDTDVPLGRDQVEEMAAPVIERTVRACRAALRDAGLTPADLAAVYLAGGSSRMPAVATAVHRALGLAPTVVEQPELVVAEGAARTVAAPVPAAPAAGAPDGGSWPAPAPTASPDAAQAAPAAPNRRRLLAVAAAGATAAALAVTTTAVLALTREKSAGVDPAAAATSPGASAPPSRAAPKIRYAAGVDPCLVGAWRMTSRQSMIDIYGTQVQFTGDRGETAVFRANGTVWIKWDYTLTARHRGARWTDIVKGTVDARYQARDGSIIYTRPRTKGTWRIERNGRRNNSGKLSLLLEPDTYVCTAARLTLAGSTYSAELVRVAPTRPSATATPAAVAAAQTGG